jgi:Universal stress protein family
MPIVVGVDGSDESRAALRWALEEARLRHTDVRAVYAWEFPVSLVAPQPFLGEPVVTEPLVDADEFRKAGGAASRSRRPRRPRRQRWRSCGTGRSRGTSVRCARQSVRERGSARGRLARPRRLRGVAARVGEPGLRSPRGVSGRDHSPARTCVVPPIPW